MCFDHQILRRGKEPRRMTWRWWFQRKDSKFDLVTQYRKVFVTSPLFSHNPSLKHSLLEVFNGKLAKYKSVSHPKIWTGCMLDGLCSYEYLTFCAPSRILLTIQTSTYTQTAKHLSLLNGKLPFCWALPSSYLPHLLQNIDLLPSPAGKPFEHPCCAGFNSVNFYTVPQLQGTRQKNIFHPKHIESRASWVSCTKPNSECKKAEENLGIAPHVWRCWTLELQAANGFGGKMWPKTDFSMHQHPGVQTTVSRKPLLAAKF